MFYDNLKAACARRNTTITAVLVALGKATSYTGTWKLGKPPRADMVMELAEYLDVTTDELLYGPGLSSRKDLCNAVATIDSEWYEIITHIPEDRRQMCKDFLRTHMTLPEKYSDSKDA